MLDWKAKFEAALGYHDFLSRYGRPEQDIPRWQRVYDHVRLEEPQRSLLRGFVRQMNVLCLAGAWCGDCVQQGPLLQRIAEAADRHARTAQIDMAFLRPRRPHRGSGAIGCESYNQSARGRGNFACSISRSAKPG